MRKKYMELSEGKVTRRNRASTTLIDPTPEVSVNRMRVVTLGDTHLPFHHKGIFNWVFDVVKALQPDAVVQIGDCYDMFSFSKYPRSLNVTTPRDELEDGRKAFEWMWNGVKAAAPQTSCYQLWSGNHDQRPLKRALESLPEAEDWIAKGLRDLYTMDGVTLVDDSAEELEIDGVLYQHGHLTHGRHAPWNQQSTVHGHTHRGGVAWWQQRERCYFELGVGWLGDVTQDAFKYHGFKRRHGTTLGLGVVDSTGPRFLPHSWGPEEK
jgi:predicted phosphodiesterase